MTYITIAQEKGFTELVALLKQKTTIQGSKPSDDVCQAASDGRLSDLQRLVAEGASVNAVDALKATPLHRAASAGQMHVLKWLLEHGANPDARGWSEAAEQEGSTPLHEATLAGHAEIARCLLEHGAKVNVKMSDRSTPLLIAAGAGQLELVKLLVAHKARADTSDPKGYTPFIMAVLGGHLETADFLVRHGADLNQRAEPFDMTALMHVAGQRLPAAVKFLLDAGADASLCDTQGQNALHHLISGAVVDRIIDMGRDEALPQGDPEDALRIVKLLLASGADPNKRDHEGMTPLACARKLRLKQIAELLEK